jgi:hypothetical protein
MASQISTSTSSPIPKGLRELLPNSESPWMLSLSTFQKIQQQPNKGKLFTALPLDPKDPECAFIIKYFNHSKPRGLGIKRIVCYHNPTLTRAFEELLKLTEEEAKKMLPQWNKEPLAQHRGNMIQRWRTCSESFSPFSVKAGRRIDAFVNCKIIPLWHGTAAVEDIANSGFTFFGKHHFFDAASKPGANASTDQGFFGSGIYFTNSAAYSSMYCSKSIFLSWISMREPYPVVNDVVRPNRGSDMKKLAGKGAYQNYNAHYIPVTSIAPNDPNCMIYHACHASEAPTYDEYVVFQKSQVLPRFCIELGSEAAAIFPIASAVATLTGQALIDKILTLEENNSIKKDATLLKILHDKSEEMILMRNKPLSEVDQKFYHWLTQLVDGSSTFKDPVKQRLMKLTSSQVSEVTSSSFPAATTLPQLKDALFSAIEKDDLNRLNLVIAQDKNLLESQNEHGHTPLLLAASRGKLNIFKALIGYQANYMAKDKNQWNVLHCAVYGKNVEIIHGFSTCPQKDLLLSGKNNNGLTPLLLTVVADQPIMFKALIDPKI